MREWTVPVRAVPVLAVLGLLCRLLPADAAVLPDAPCQVSASERSEVAPLVPGVLSEVLVDRGAHVTKGQVLARLHSEVEQAELHSALLRASGEAALRQRRAKLAMSERTLARNSDLLAKHAISDQDLDQLRTDHAMAQMDVLAAQEAIAQARSDAETAKAAVAVRELRSPIDGVVTERDAEPGERAGEKPVLVVQRLDRLRVEAVLPASLYGRLHAGSVARLYFDLPNLAPRDVPIDLVDPVIDPKTDTFMIRLSLDNHDLSLPAGLKCRIDPMVEP
jgi:RND family efflux transporter MFP subunit